MSKRNKYKLQRMKLYLRKNVLTTRFAVRNTLVLMIAVSVVFLTVFAVGSLKEANSEKKTVKDSYNTVSAGKETASETAVGAADTAVTESPAVKNTSEEGKIGIEAVEVNSVTEVKYNMAGKVIASADSIYVRKTADNDGEIVGYMYKGAVGEIVAAKGDWIQIKSGKVKGYVEKSEVLRDKAATEAAEDYVVKVAVIKQNANVLSSVETDSSKIFTASSGSIYEVSQFASSDTVKCIRLADGAYGYIAAESVRVTDGFPEAFSAKELRNVINGRNSEDDT